VCSLETDNWVDYKNNVFQGFEVRVERLVGIMARAEVNSGLSSITY
jgi:hypothetical protein